LKKWHLSIKVKLRLAKSGIITTHEERKEIYRLLSEKTGLPLNEAIDFVSDEELKEIVKEAKRRQNKNKVLSKVLANLLIPIFI